MNHNHKKIKIVHLITAMNIGGAEILLLNIAKNIDPQKFEITVATTVKGGPMTEEFLQQGVTVEIFEKKSKLGLVTILTIRKFLKKIKPDIVHTHLFGGDTWGRIAAILAGVPVIISTEHNINRDEGMMKRFVKKILSLWTKRIIAVSESVKKYSISTEHIKAKKFTIIYNAVDLDNLIFRGQRPVDLNNIKAGIIGRLTTQKGHLDLIAALPEILKNYPNFHLAIIGAGEMETELKNAIKILKLEKAVDFLGVRRDLPIVLNNLDLLLLPSVWEGFGLAAVEAMAVGVPVLASAVGGLKEIIVDKQSGFLFESQNPVAMAETVNYVLANLNLLPEVILKARHTVEEKFEIKKMVKNYEALYFELFKK